MANQTLSLSDSLLNYMQNINMPEHPLLKELREETYQLERHQMMSSPEEMSFIAFLIKLLKPKSILELGTFTGYCTLGMALAAGKETSLVTCDIDKQWPQIGMKYWIKAKVEKQINLRVGVAVDTMIQLKPTHRFDFIFIDADKTNYRKYFDMSLEMLTDDGIILVDNIFWGGEVIDSSANSFETKAIRQFNEYLLNVKGVYHSVLPIADGLTLVAKGT